MKYVTGDKSNTFTKSNNLEKKSKGYLSKNITNWIISQCIYIFLCCTIRNSVISLSFNISERI